MIYGLTPFELSAISLSLVVGGFLKGATGVGMPVIVIPVMALFMGIEAAVIVMAIPGVVWNGWMTWHHRQCYPEVSGMNAILLAGVVGTVLGVAVLSIASERFLSLILLGWIIVYIGTRILHPELSLGERARKLFSPWVGLAAGVFQGATGISAPVLATYFHALKLRPDAYVFAVSAPFAVLGLAQVLSFGVASMFTADLLVLALLSLVPAAVFIPLGIYVRPMINRDLFDKLVLIMVALMGIRLALNSW
jgi:uncharacterized membrane protein YfcA